MSSASSEPLRLWICEGSRYLFRVQRVKSESLRSWIDRGPFTLALSSSFFGFYAHAGLMQAFEEAGICPAKITGASAGALVGGAWASGMNAAEVRDLLFRVKRSDFWDPGFGPGFLRGGKFRRLLKENFVSRFEDTRIPFEASVFDIFRGRTVYLHRGDLASAVAASCAVPGLFQPVRREGRWLWDGGVLDKPGVNVEAARAAGERVLSVFLETGSRAVSWYERRTGSQGPRLDHNGRVFRITGMPSVNFNRLEVGPLAYERCADFARQALK